MAEVRIQTPPPGVYKWLSRQEFDGRFYRMFFRWNVRAGFWYVDFANDTNVAQVRSVRMNLSKDKLAAFKHQDVPQGSFDVIDVTGTGTEPTLESFGSTVNIRYVEFVNDTVLPVAEEVEPVFA